MKKTKNQDVFIGNGNLAGKGVFAARDFKKGEIVIAYDLKEISEVELNRLPESEKMFTHIRNSKIYLYSEPERYVNHSTAPNTLQDFELGADVAIRDIRMGEMITCDATLEDF